MSDHVWSERTVYFTGLCSMMLRPEDANSCFAQLIPKDGIIGSVDFNLGYISCVSTANGEPI